MEHRAALGLVLCPDSALVRQNNGARDGEPDPHALLLGREERVEDLGEPVRRNSRTGITDRNYSRLFPVQFRATHHSPSVGYRSHRIHTVHNQVDAATELNRPSHVTRPATPSGTARRYALTLHREKIEDFAHKLV